MSIPESQLETWSNQGAVATAKQTHEAIRLALAAHGPLQDKSYEVYLQGSYKNSTNIYSDSDVDVVVQLNSTFLSNKEVLPSDQRALFEEAYSDATYTWKEFRADVLAALRSYFGAELIREGNKSIKIGRGSGRLSADVVPCLQYRNYGYFKGRDEQRFLEGIVFWTLFEDRKVINYPKLHYENGTTKNNDEHTAGWFKPSVRMFKNARKYLADHSLLEKKVAPSYFIECLVYNAPDGCFGPTYQNTYLAVLDWFSRANPSQMMCQNGVIPLFGSSPEQWNYSGAVTYMNALWQLWQHWGADAQLRY